MESAKDAIKKIHAASGERTAADLLAENKFLRKYGWKLERVSRHAPIYAATALSRRWWPTPEYSETINGPSEESKRLNRAARLPLAEWGNPRPITFSRTTGLKVFSDDAMNLRCSKCERLVKQCICKPDLKGKGKLR